MDISAGETISKKTRRVSPASIRNRVSTTCIPKEGKNLVYRLSAAGTPCMNNSAADPFRMGTHCKPLKGWTESIVGERLGGYEGRELT